MAQQGGLIASPASLLALPCNTWSVFAISCCKAAQLALGCAPVTGSRLSPIQSTKSGLHGESCALFFNATQPRIHPKWDCRSWQTTAALLWKPGCLLCCVKLVDLQLLYLYRPEQADASYDADVLRQASHAQCAQWMGHCKVPC